MKTPAVLFLLLSHAGLQRGMGDSLDQDLNPTCNNGEGPNASCETGEDKGVNRDESKGTFLSPSLGVGEILPLAWITDGKEAHQLAFRIGLPPKLTSELRAYCDRLGLTDLFRSLEGDDPIVPGEERFVEMTDGHRWYAQRPESKWQSNMHWVSPADEATHEDYLAVLAAGDFDMVLDSVGEHFDLDSLVAYHLTFIGVSHCTEGFVHHDTTETGGKVFNMIIPLILEEDGPAELILEDDQDERVGAAKYEYGVGIGIGDDARHGTAACDYRDKGGMRMAATVYIADINDDNVEQIASTTLTQVFPVPSSMWLNTQRGRHWGGESTLKQDKGRKPFNAKDEWSADECAPLVEQGKCESDTEETRMNCLKSCNVFMENSVYYDDYEEYPEWYDNYRYEESEDEDESEDEGDDESEDESDDDDEDGDDLSDDIDGKNEGSFTFLAPRLRPGKVSPLRWKKDKKVATKNAVRIGLPPELRRELRAYTDRLGLTDLFRSLVGSNPNTPGEAKFVELTDGHRWYVHRPDSKWQSNMHWVSPADEATHEEYLEVLGAGNFDVVLDAIGNYFELDGLVAHDLTFIAVSHCSKGYVHWDTTETGGKIFNVLIPLILEEDGPAEFIVVDDKDDSRAGAAKYEYDVALSVGDDVLHGTAAVDYRDNGGMRMAASVYIADINDDNVQSIVDNTLTQIFPVADTEWLNTQRSRHWGGESTVANDFGRMPFNAEDEWGADECAPLVEEGKCESDFEGTRMNCLKSCGVYIENKEYFDDYADYQDYYDNYRYGDSGNNRKNSFLAPPLKPGEISLLTWKADEKEANELAFRVGLPPQLTAGLRAYCDNLGLTDLFRSLESDDPISPGNHKFVELTDGHKWYAQRPPSHYNSNMHWVSPADEQTHEEYLQVLADGDFDAVLDAIGNHFQLESLAAYHLTFIAVSHCSRGFVHHDTTETGGKVFNVIVPLILEEDAPGELIVVDDEDENRIGSAKYEYNVGIAVGDDAMHGTEACDYRDSGGMRMGATIYVADINDENVEQIASDTLTQVFPLPDTAWLQAQKGRHWGLNGTLKENSGRKSFAVVDEWGDRCAAVVTDGNCESETARRKCLKSCKVYLEEK